MRTHRKTKNDLTLPDIFRAPCEKRPSGVTENPVALTPLRPAPSVAVIEPSERVPSEATFRATTELFDAFVMK